MPLHTRVTCVQLNLILSGPSLDSGRALTEAESQLNIEFTLNGSMINEKFELEGKQKEDMVDHGICLALLRKHTKYPSRGLNPVPYY
jgi:hypothetical protein